MDKNDGVHFNLSPVGGTPTGAARRGRCPIAHNQFGRATN